MDTNERWMQMERQVAQLAGEMRDRRAKMNRLQEALDDVRLELGHVQGDVRHLRAGVPAGHAEGSARPAPTPAQLLDTIESVADQLREVVALHRVFRDMAALLREVTGGHEARIRALEARLSGGVHPAVH